MSTKVRDRESIALGLAELYLSDSASYITDVTSVLTDAEYFSALVEVSFNIFRTKKFQYSYVNSMEALQDIFTKRVGFSISIAPIEMNSRTFSYALGGDDSEEIGSTLFTKPKDLRAELIFTYPNKTNFMYLILPRVSVISDIDGAFSEKDAMKVPIEFNAKRADNVTGGSVWASYPYGRQYFI